MLNLDNFILRRVKSINETVANVLNRVLAWLSGVEYNDHRKKDISEWGHPTMATIFDVANWFLAKEPMTPKKVQKLCYYYKAWGLALYGDDLLPDAEFQAWVHGPVCPALYQEYKEYGWNDIPQFDGELYPFNEKEIDVLESVWVTYGEMTANALEAHTHSEEPWQRARVGLAVYQNCENPIQNDWMKSYYRKVYETYQGE